LIGEIILVVGEAEISRCKSKIVDPYGLSKIRSIIAGGKERQDSINQGLQVLADDCQWVVVHDGARPLLINEVLKETIQAAYEWGAAVTAVPTKDTIKVAGPKELVQSTLDRRCLWSIQTPQVFKRALLVQAYAQAYADGFYGTDDASLVERIGAPVKLVRGSYENLKVTTPEDLDFAEAILKRRKRG
jgi:2-C-methyl-D-erythritol 4-phosphate cytidylyltransferase